jgi:signal recognition particle receptor subunit beta
VRSFKVRLQLFTVPGQIMYAATRRLVLRGADALVFVADSQEERFEANLISLEDLHENLAQDSRAELPVVVQYNKRDLPRLVPVPALRAHLNPRGAPEFEAAASSGAGVFPTLKAAAGLALATLAQGPAARPA